MRLTEAVSMLFLVSTSQSTRQDVDWVSVAWHRNSGARPEAGTKVSYTAAATQYRPFDDWHAGGPQLILDNNFNTILQLAKNAHRQEVDLIVFPEYGLTSTNLGPNRTEFKKLCQVVPDPNENRVPCMENFNQDNYHMVQCLSCLALELEMYLVIDLAELSLTHRQMRENHHNKGHEPHQRDEEYFVAYNTQVVFDRTGAVIARYRKKHLFLEPAFEYGMEDDSTALFVTDFGVTFTLQVCFDIMYASPGLANVLTVGVRDVAMATAWVDELPFLTAPQIFSSWSRGIDVNLIVSNLYNPSSGEVGSGIFHGNSGDNPNYTYDSEYDHPILIVNNVTTSVTGEQYSNNIWRKIAILLNGVKVFGKCRKVLHYVLKILIHSDPQVSELLRYQTRLQCNRVCNKVRDLVAGTERSTPPENEATSSATILANVDQRRSTFMSTPESYRNKHEFIHENISRYSSVILSPPESIINETKEVECCYRDTFCCRATYSYTSYPNKTSQDTYMLLAYNGTVAKGSGVYEMWTQVCAVVYCTGQDIMSCANIDSPLNNLENRFRLELITGIFDTDFIYPTIFNLDFTLADTRSWTFLQANGTETNTAMEINSVINNVLTASLFGRWYSMDP